MATDEEEDGKSRRERFLSLRCPEDVARLLRVKYATLNYYLYGLSAAKQYTQFSIPKRRGGQRVIRAPQNTLKTIQHRLHEVLVEVYAPKKCTHGFVNLRNVKTNAQGHVRCRHVLNVDLKDFFPSINFGRVRGLFMAKPYELNDKVATVLAQICCHKNELPQGAPTSPIVSNMICARMDVELSRLAREHHCLYSRYADDMTFSRRRGAFPDALAVEDENGIIKPGKDLIRVIVTNGFLIHPDKIKLLLNSFRQEVTGLVVNRKVNVTRSYIRQLRAMIHAWDEFGYEAANEEHRTIYYPSQRTRQEVPELRDVLRSRVAYVAMIKGIGDPVVTNLRARLARVDPTYEDLLMKYNNRLQNRDFFISHASEDRDEVARPLAEALIGMGHSVWFDEYELQVGDSLRRSIDDGLRVSTFGVVIVSKSFFRKKWPQKELDGLTALEDKPGERILPIWHQITEEEVKANSAMLADQFALNTKDGIEKIAAALSGKWKSRKAES